MPTVKRQLQPVLFTQVAFDDGFWARRLEVNRTVTIPHIYQQLEASGRIRAFDLNFQRPVPSPIVLIFGDSDPAKWIEAASYSLATHPDPALAALVDSVADKMIHAQQPDGYLNTHFIVAQPEMRWRNLRDWHELYCAGHLIEGAVAHYRATGQRKLLDALSRYADLIDATFGCEPGKLPGYCGHPEIELALVKLYHATQNPRYLELATYFIDERGQQPHYFDIEARARGEDPADYWAKTYEYCQAHVPIREQDKVVGHAVRAVYLLSAVADLAHENNDQTLLETAERLWTNLVTRRMYLTGGIGAAHNIEGFTQDYDLPDETAYAETCAAIGLMLFNHRLLQFSGESKYADIIERALYNGFLSGVSLDGARFFYENPLASAGHHHRESWFTCPCCPPNLARTLASLGQYFYSTGANGVWVHLYGQSTVTVQLNQREIRLRQVTQYPWDGYVKVEVGVAAPQRFTLHLRVPAWCERWRLAVNGEPVAANESSVVNGYISLTREWKPGDVVEYSMEMPLQTIWAHPAVRDLQGRVALARGPIVYCLEGVDHDGTTLDRIAINPQTVAHQFTVEYDENLLGGICVLRGQASVVDERDWENILYSHTPPPSKSIDITAIPYYAWDNRAPGEMRVWIRAGGG
ncbi:MAG TPA: beta-L-arabinofuranosidase domain-containing protein [Anaerolineae bacterium]|nr:beta-L-arabinofuranosidase domain-containing protein [Anaerolineae bacterium]